MLSNLKSPRVVAFITLSLLLLLTLASDVFADQVVNTIDTTVDPTLETRTITAGGSTIVSFYIRSQGGGGDIPGCNVDTVAATVNLSIPAGVTASPTSLTFNDCGNVNQNTQPVTFSSNLAGSYTIMVASVTGGEAGSLFDTAPATFTLVVNPPADTTPPVITPNVSGTLGNNGWYISDVTVSWTLNDPESTITSTSGCDTTVITTDTSGTTLTCSATSAGGTNSQSVTIKRDATAPSASASRSPAANLNGWNNADVTVSFSGTDAMSGIASCSANVLLSSEGAGQSASGTCTDNAGNVSASATASDINIDKTAPVVTPFVAPLATIHGWNNSDVTVTFSGDDGIGSGIDFCSAAVILTAEGAMQPANGSCTDKAGNTGYAGTFVNIDKTAPTASASVLPGANANGWNNSDVTVTFSGDDGIGSGIDFCSAAVVLSSEGDGQSASGTCTDLAGNVSALATASGINIDKTAPSASASASPGANANGWNNTNVTVTFSGSDALSGIDFCDAPVVLSSEGAGQSASGTCTDKAGNVSALATASGINIDKTFPTASASVSPGANANGWNNTNVTVTFSGSDALSGIDFCDAPVVLSSEGAGQFATGTCTDKAGNESAMAVASGINIDKTAPTASASASPSANANGWNNTDVTVTFSGSDALSGIDFCDAPVVLSSEGAGQSASGTCTDKAGNVSALATASGINIDKTTPSVSVTGVTDGSTYTLGSVPAAGCTTSDGLSGVAVNASLNVTGGPVVGTFIATCSGALDNAGNSGLASATYYVIYNFNGFFAPVDNPPVVNTVKAGSAIPVKFSLGGNQGLGILADGSPTSGPVSCAFTPFTDPIEETMTAGSSSLQYDPATDQYIYVWKTNKLWAGTCRALAVKLIDGTTHYAYFKFNK